MKRSFIFAYAIIHSMAFFAAGSGNNQRSVLPKQTLKQEEQVGAPNTSTAQRGPTDSELTHVRSIDHYDIAIDRNNTVFIRGLDRIWRRHRSLINQS